jgi:hypothetical protein
MSEDLPQNEKRSNKLRAQQKRDKVTRDLVIRTLLGTMDGRRYLWLELGAANVFASTFVPGEDGARRSAFMEGQRASGLRLLADITRVSADGYVAMMRENSGAVLEEEEEEATPDE